MKTLLLMVTVLMLASCVTAEKSSQAERKLQTSPYRQ